MSTLDVLNEPQPTKLNDAAVENLLSTIFGTSSISQAGGYFYLHSLNMREFEKYAGYATTNPDQPFPVTKYTQHSTSATLNIQSIKALQTVPPFVGAAELYHVFVYLDATTLVPYQTASLLSTCFISGLVTRLLLERYAIKWRNLLGVALNLTLAAAPLPGRAKRGNRGSVPSPMNATDWIATYLTSLSRSLLVSGTWTSLGQSDYCSALSMVTPATLQAIGMVKGWTTGDALVASSADYAACEAKIWKWLNSRYTTRQIGTIAGYTLCYLAGFLESERTQALINGQASPPSQLQGPDNIRNVFGDLNNWDGSRSRSFQFQQDPAFDIVNGLFEVVNGEFYAVAQQQPFPNRSVVLSDHQAFLNGFTDGITEGAQVMFVDLFDAGWNLGYAYGYTAGYSTGFQSGYSQGYSAGYQEGYAVGYNAGQPTWMSGLQTVINDVGSIVSDVKTVGTILGDISTAGQILGALF